MFDSLSSVNRLVAKCVGVEIDRLYIWRTQPPSSAVKQQLHYHTAVRFYHALVLHEYLLWEDMQELRCQSRANIDKSVQSRF